MSTKQLIDEVLRLDAAATKGPWWPENVFVENSHGELASTVCGLVDFSESACHENARLIAHYRQSCPRVARALRRAVELLRQDAGLSSYAGDDVSKMRPSQRILAEIEKELGDAK